MYNTYKNLREIANLFNGEKDLNQITVQYQQTSDPVLMATVFVEYFPYLLKLSQNPKYYYLSESDKASYIVEEVHRAMMDFDPEKKTKIQTLIATYCNNRLRSEVGMAATHKRKSMGASDSYEVIMESIGRDRKADGKRDDRFGEIESIESILAIDELTDNERKYCCLVMSYESEALRDSDIASLIGISPSAINQLKKSLAKKLAFLRTEFTSVFSY